MDVWYSDNRGISYSIVNSKFSIYKSCSDKPGKIMSTDYDLIYVPDYLSNLVYGWDSPTGGASTTGSHGRSA